MFTPGESTSLSFRDWGPRAAQPIMFRHGWPLGADSCANQLLFFLAQRYRVITHDPRGHGHTDTGNGMDACATDVGELRHPEYVDIVES